MSFAYSTDRECYYGNFATREEALDAGRKETGEGDPVYTAEREEVDLSKLVGDWAWQVIDDMGERAGEEYGEFAEGWPEIAQSEQDALDEAIREAVVAWFKSSGNTPAFFRINSDTVEQAS